MKIEELKNKKILILGLGREGQATLRFLREHGLGSIVGLADQRKREDFKDEENILLKDAEQAGQKLHLGQDYLNALVDYEVIIKSPGISVTKTPAIAEALQKGVKLTSATNIFFTNVQGKVIAVTGSKGKSTTSSLIAAVMKEAKFPVELVGNIGKPALDFLKDDNVEKYYVYEISSYQLEDFAGSADIAVLVSFFPEHLDYHGDESAYLGAKMQIASHLKPSAKVIYNFASEKLHTEIVKIFGVEKNEQVITFNNGKNSRIDENYCVIVDEKKLVCLQDMILFGVHNLENILAVCEVAKLLNISMSVVAATVNSFKGLEHRLEKVGEFQSIVFYNDAISTTPESTMAALAAMKTARLPGQNIGVDTLIAGGFDRGYQFEQLAEKIVEDSVKNLILFPETGLKIADEVKKYAEKNSKTLPKIIEVKNMEEAVRKAYEFTSANSICLLSCASPSFNLFKNFEDRGNQFKKFVKEIGESGI